MSDTIGRATVREWLERTASSIGMRERKATVNDAQSLLRLYDAAFPPPAPPLPRCHYCGGEQKREDGFLDGGRRTQVLGVLRCQKCTRRWFSRLEGNPTDAEIAAEYERPVRLAEARGRVEGAIRASGVDPQSTVDRYRAELARLESEGGPT